MIPKRLQGLKANDAATVDACLADLAATGTPQEFDALLDGVRVERVPVASTLPPAGKWGSALHFDPQVTTLVPNAFFKGGAAVRPFRDRALLGAISIAPDRALGDALESVVLTGQTKAPPVNLHAAEVIDVDVRPCARLANLTWLGVTRCAGVIGLEALEAATKLEGLAIHWATDLVDLQSLRCPTLRRLRVDWCNRLRSLGDGDGFPHFRELGVTMRAALPPLSRFRDLEVVDLMNADDPAVGESLRGLPGLRSVTLRSSNGVRDLAVFERAERMEN